ncbi:MAG: hypothetical protein WKF61_06360 [Luteimonas sp.]
MADSTTNHDALPPTWSDAFASLPLEAAPENGWARITATLDARRRSRAPIWLATAAALVLAIALPWQLSQRNDVPGVQPSLSVSAATSDTLETLYAESAQLESLLQFARDDRVSSGTAAALAGELDSQLASIDAALMRPGLSPDQQMSLWRDRVEALRTLTSFESTRRWLVANGSRYDGALAQVD